MASPFFFFLAVMPRKKRRQKLSSPFFPLLKGQLSLKVFFFFSFLERWLLEVPCSLFFFPSRVASSNVIKVYVQG